MNRLSISLSPPENETIRRAVRVLSMVHELHKAGCQLLRIIPGKSPSGCYWRVTITTADRIAPNHGAMPLPAADNGGGEESCVSYSTGQDNEFFEWEDAESDSARQLAAKFIERFPSLVESGTGRDWAYVGWYAEMLGRAEHGDLPMAYFDQHEDPRPGCLPTTEHAYDSDLPLPPRPPGR
jgi:hypothetical protein